MGAWQVVCLGTSCLIIGCVVLFFFKQKTAYEMRISDWSSDVCSSDLAVRLPNVGRGHRRLVPAAARQQDRAAALRRDQFLPADGLEHRPAAALGDLRGEVGGGQPDRKSTRLNSSH